VSSKEARAAQSRRLGSPLHWIDRPEIEHTGFAFERAESAADLYWPDTPAISGVDALTHDVAAATIVGVVVAIIRVAIVVVAVAKAQSERADANAPTKAVAAKSVTTHPMTTHPAAHSSVTAHSTAGLRHAGRKQADRSSRRQYNKSFTQHDHPSSSDTTLRDHDALERDNVADLSALVRSTVENFAQFSATYRSPPRKSAAKHVQADGTISGARD
jgi:hypothetical protein